MSRAKALALLLVALVSASHARARAAEPTPTASIASAPAANIPAVPAAKIAEARAALYAGYSAKLAELASWCGEHELPEAAAQLRAWLPQREQDKLTLFLLPATDASAEKDKSGASEWRTRWQALRDEQAESLVALAKRSADEHHPWLAFELLTEAVRENPNQALARTILGYVRFRDAWHTPFEVKQLRAGKVWTEKFGWIPRPYVERYEKGQRQYQGRWMSAADEAAMRRDLKRGWHVESDHYLVTTNHSLEEGVRLSRRLEMLYAVWQQVFAPYLGGEAELARRFEGRAARRDAVLHDVVYYRSRDEYNQALRSAQPKIDITLGIYFDTTRTAYFFAGDDQEPGTLYHEATHQLFHETRPVAADVGRDENFWIVEGIACYMESMSEHAGYCTLGGANAGRMPAARFRLLEDNFYVPLAELVAMGMESLQRDPRIARLYSQSAGLADFLMHDGQGRYRDALVRYLDLIYAGRATTHTLCDLTGANYETLDRQYRAFMTQGEPADGAPHNAAR